MNQHVRFSTRLWLVLQAHMLLESDFSESSHIDVDHTQEKNRIKLMR
jgi:hypothetical protein